MNAWLCVNLPKVLREYLSTPDVMDRNIATMSIEQQVNVLKAHSLLSSQTYSVISSSRIIDKVDSCVSLRVVVRTRRGPSLIRKRNDSGVVGT